ncbi:MAG: family 10 glycosylhydrolase, partial [Clostridia bacterium]|nr:family 10 glycosylhydrolase [Clostridia bacterium]
MKRKYAITALLLVLCALMCACAQPASVTTDEPETSATQEETETVTETPTEPPSEPPTEAVTAEAVTEEPPEEENMALNYTDMKAIWLSQFDLNGVYTGTRGQRAEDDFREKLSVVLDNVIKNHYNTIIVQCRPYADSMYPSDICPPCYLVTGKYSKEFTYDPFAIIVEEAHKRDLSVQAWI